MRKFILRTILVLQTMFLTITLAFLPCISNAQVATTTSSPNNIEALIKKANNYDESAQYQLGVIYAKGIGVKKNEAEAIKWFKKAASNGSSDAAFNLGLMYERGMGTPKNIKLAFKYYNDAALLADADAEYKVSIMYAYGEGTPKDLINAYAWMAIAIELGTLSKELQPLAVRFTDELKKQLSSDELKKAEKVKVGYLAILEGLGLKVKNTQ